MYLTAAGKPYMYNLTCYQGPQMTCGQHVLFYYYHRARGYSMKEILTDFDSEKTLSNDIKVIKFYNNTK